MKWLLTGLLFGFQTASAGVWEPGRTWTVDVPGDAHQARVTSIGGKPQVVVTGSFGTWVVDPSMGVAVQKSSLKGTGLWVDSEYDPKWPDLLVCGASGMTLLPTQPGGFGETTSLILKPCQALGMVDVSFQEYGAPITARDEVKLCRNHLRPR